MSDINNNHFVNSFFFGGTGFEIRSSQCKAGTLPCEPHTPPVHFALVILDMGVYRTICLHWL
jgi:hypothetical protein